MNPKIILGIFIFLFIPIVSATTLFNDTFESGNLNQWNLTGTGVVWTAITTNPYAGSYHAQSRAPGTSSFAYIGKSLDTTNYDNITISYYRRLVGLDGPDEFEVRWYDGTTWTILEATGTSTANDATYLYRNYTLPTSASNNPAFILRFGCMAGATTEYCRVDNVFINGTFNNNIQPITSASFNYSISNATNGHAISIRVSANGSAVNTTIQSSDIINYAFMGKGVYDVYFKNLVSLTGAISIRRGMELQYNPNGIYWSSSNGDDIIDANPAGNAIAINDSIYWNDAYATGIGLKYTYQPTELKEYLIINNREILGNPSAGTLAGQNLSFKHQFNVWSTLGADLYVDGVKWNETIGSISGTTADFKYNDQNVFSLHLPYAFDSAGHTVNGWYNFRRTSNALYVEMNIPFEFMNATTTQYPVTIDPTTYIDLNGTLVIDLSDDTYNPLQQIVLNEVQGEGDVLIDTQIQDGRIRYAIDPIGLDFTIGHADVKSAVGNQLLKCTDWHYDTEICGNETDEEWILVSTITPNTTYDFNFTNTDPAYAEYILSPGEQTTGSTTFVNVVSKNITSGIDGPYLIFGSGAVSSAATNRQVYTQSTLDGVQFAAFNREGHDASNLLDYPSFSFLTVAQLNSSNHTINVDFRSATGSTVYIRDVSINAQYLSYYNSANTTAQQSLTTSLATYNNLTFTPKLGGAYMIYAYGEFAGPGSTTYLDYAYLYQDEVQLDDVSRMPKDITDYTSFTMFRRVNLTEGQTVSFTQRALEQNVASAGVIRRLWIVAIPIEQDYDFQYTNKNGQTNATTVNVPVQVLNLSFQPLYPGAYIISSTAQGYTTSTSRSYRANLTLNGVNVCYSIKEPEAANTEHTPVTCLVPVTLANVTNNISLYVTLLQGAGTATLDDSTLGVYAINSTINTCEYRGFGIWSFIINKYCRILRRTVGDGSSILVKNTNTTESGVIIRDFTELNVTNSSTFTIDSGTNITIGTY